MPAGYSLTWSGQYEYMERAPARLYSILPLTLLIIATLLYLSFRNVIEVVILMGGRVRRLSSLEPHFQIVLTTDSPVEFRRQHLLHTGIGKH